MARAFSLHIGLNSLDPGHYDGWSGPLVACEADAAAMRSICVSQGFQADTLLTAAATRRAVIEKLNGYADSLAAGDTLVVSYAGHGGQLPDRNRDEDDNLDETWCLYDGELLDDELYTAWAAFQPGVRIAVFSDSCHSGTVLRNVVLSGRGSTDLRPRVMPPELQLRTYTRNRNFYDRLLSRDAPPPNPTCTVVLVSGCQDNQLSMDGPFNGAFTSALMVVWNDGRFKGGYADFMKAIRARLPDTQSPNFMQVGARNDDFVNGQIFSHGA